MGYRAEFIKARGLRVRCQVKTAASRLAGRLQAIRGPCSGHRSDQEGSRQGPATPARERAGDLLGAQGGHEAVKFLTCTRPVSQLYYYPWAGKVAVMGLLQRHPGKGKSRVRTAVVPSTKRQELMSRIIDQVEDGTRVYTDDLKSYDNLGAYYTHNVINHAECYAKGQVHTNGMENFWSLLKRSIRGTYVSVEPFHLFRYLDEQAFRFNEREHNDAERFVRTMQQIQGRRLTYDNLVARPHDL